MKMIAKRPQDRYTTWDAVIQRLRSPQEVSVQDLNIQSLVKRALESHQVAEQSRLDAEENRKRIKDNDF